MTPSCQAGRRLPQVRGPRHRRKAARSRRQRLLLEPLEERTLLTVSITGTVFNDLNSNGLRDGNEPLLPGATVSLQQNQGGTLGSDVTVQAKSLTINGSDPLGFGVSTSNPLTVAGLPSGVTHLRVNLDVTNSSPDRILIALFSPTGIAPTGQIVSQDGNGPNLLFLGAGQRFVGSFDDQAATPITLAQPPFGGNYRPYNAFTDPGSHIYDGSPDGNWYLFFIDGNTGTVSNVTLNSWSLTFGLPTAQTDALGSYAFNDLSAGQYRVSLQLPSGDVQTLPGGGTGQDVTVTAGQTAGGVSFGVHAAADLAGDAFQITSPAPDWGKTVSVHYTLTNQGAGDAGPFDVQLRLSPNGVIGNDPGEPVLSTLHFSGLTAFTSSSGSVTVQLPGLPGTPPPGFAGLDSTYLGFLIDPVNAVAETDRTNNSNQGQGIDLSVIAPLPNQAITTGPGVHQQPSIAVDPSNPKHLVVAYMDYTIGKDGYAGIGVASSGDGGTTWTTGAVPLPAGFDEAAGYPVAKFDDQGHVFVSFMAATFLGPKPPLIYPRGQDPNSTSNPKAQYTSYEFQANNGIFVARSDDDGRTWNTPVAVVSHLYTGTPVVAEATPDLAIDTFKTLPNGQPNPKHDNLYLTWTRAARLDANFGLSVVKVAVSRDGGATWGAARTVPAAGNSHTAAAGNGNVDFSHVTVGPEGDLYVSAYDGGSFDVFHSSDAGATFRAPVFDPNTGEQNGIPFGFLSALPNPTLLNDSFRTLAVRSIAADPTRPGTVYAVEAIQVQNASKLIDAADVNFAVSHDYGQTWEEVFTVGSNTPNISDVPMDQRQGYHAVLNDDDGARFLDLVKLNNEVLSGQALPRLSVDEKGNIAVIWYDTRRDPANHNLEVFGVTSTDGGHHFTANYRVTDASFDPNAGTFTDAVNQPDPFLGDAIGLATVDGTAYAVWTDTRLNAPGQTGNQDIFFARYPIVPAPAPPDDRFDPNNSPAAAVDLGAVSIRQVVPRLAVSPGADDWFRLETRATSDLFVAASTSAANATLVVELWDSTGAQRLATGTNLVDANGHVIGAQVSLPVSANQSYLLHIALPSDAAASVPYSLTLRALTGDLGTQVAGKQAGTLTAGAQAIYRLGVPVTGALQVNLTTGANASGTFLLRILSADGLTVLAQAFAAGSGKIASASIAVQAGQVVLLQVGLGTGDYTLDFTNVDQFQESNPDSLFFPTHGDPSVLQVADLNGDGKPDLVSASTDFNDPVSVLLNRGDGTFKAARAFDAGPGGLHNLTVANLNGDKVPDLAVTNHTSGDVSILLGNGDGTFLPQLRFNAVAQVDAIASGDFRGNRITDLVVLQRDANSNGAVLGVLLGRGDGTFAPPERLTTDFKDGAGVVLVGDLNHDGHPDIVAFSFNSSTIDIFYGNGDGTFQPVAHPVDRDGNILVAAENVAAAKLVDLNGANNLAIITSGTVDGVIGVMLSNGDGTFQPPQVVGVPNIGGVATTIASFVVGDFANFIGGAGPFGHADIVAIARPRLGTNLPELIVFPEKVDASGHFAGYDPPQVLMADQFLGPLAFGNLTGNEIDIAAAVPGGVRVLYGNPPVLLINNTPQTARALGTVVHEVTTTMSIVPTQEDAYFTLAVPVEAVTNAGPEVIDFSGLFRFQGGMGISMEVLGAGGNLLGSGSRFRVIAAQGQVLTLHVFGVTASDHTRGVGAYTLDIDVLPQVVSVQAEAFLSGAGGPTTSIVVTLQGDRLDPAAAQNPANYHVIYLGTEQLPSPVAPREISLASGIQSVIYNPSANINVLTGDATATAVRQTITLLFTAPLPVGNYEIDFDPTIGATSLDSGESLLVAQNGNAVAHPLVAVVNAQITSGVHLSAPGLVPQSGALGSFDGFAAGSPFLTQFHDDLGRVLDAGLNQFGDQPAVTQAILAQVNQHIGPSLGADSRTTSFLVLWLDPVSINLVDPAGKRAIYDLKSNTVANQQSRTFVEVGGNIEVLVLADVAGTFTLNVADVPATARGGAVVFSPLGDQSFALTDALRAGIDSFSIDVPALVSTGPVTNPQPKTPGGQPGTPPDTNALSAALLIGITTAPIFSSTVTTEASNSTTTAISLASVLASTIGSLSAAVGSGVSITAASVEQFFRDFADRLGDRLNSLATEVGNDSQLLANSGLRTVRAPAQAIYSALEAMGLPEIPMPASPLGEVGSDILRAILPTVKAIGDAGLKLPNGQKNPVGPMPAPAGGGGPKGAPAPHPDDLLPEDGDTAAVVPPPIESENKVPGIAAALVVAGLSFGWREKTEGSDDCDEDDRRHGSKTKS